MAVVTIPCPHCGQDFEADGTAGTIAGQELSCPTCSKIILIPPITDIGDPDVVGSGSRQITYAGFGRRFAAYLIDCFIAIVVVVVISLLVGTCIDFALDVTGADFEIARPVYKGIGFAIGQVLPWLYCTVFESSSKQATPGKMALGIVVIDLDGQRISFARANGRFWGKIISTLILNIGYFMIAFTKKKQGLHDIMAGCLVIRK
jgi:uncharacterized RDD family membrane protein YckC